MKVRCPACKKGHGELAPGDYRCVCTAEFRVESQENPVERKRYSFDPERAESRNPAPSRPGESVGWWVIWSGTAASHSIELVKIKRGRYGYRYRGGGRMMPGQLSAKNDAEADSKMNELVEGGKTFPQGKWVQIFSASSDDGLYKYGVSQVNPHQAGQGRITPEGWREHQKHIPIPKGWQLAPSRGPVGMRVAKPRPGMVWIVQSSVAVTAPPTRAQREMKGVPKKYSHKTGRRGTGLAATPPSFEQYSKEEGMERTRSTPVRASDPSASDVPPESYVSQISSRMGESARKRLSGNNPGKGFIWTAYGINDKPLKGYRQLFAFNRKDAHRRFNHEYGSKVGKGEIAYLVGDTFSQWESNPDDPSGYWDYPPVEVSGMTYPGRRIKMLESDNWMDVLGPSRGGGNGHIADPFTKQRHFGMFSAKGNKAVEQFALRWRDVVLSGQSVDWEEEVVPELRQLRELPGLGEVWDTEVREAIYDYIAQGDREVEMDGEIYQYPPMVTPDYYRMHDD